MKLKMGNDSSKTGSYLTISDIAPVYSPSYLQWTYSRFRLAPCESQAISVGAIIYYLQVGLGSRMRSTSLRLGVSQPYRDLATRVQGPYNALMSTTYLDYQYTISIYLDSTRLPS